MKFKFDTKSNYVIISPQTALNAENLSSIFEEAILPFLNKEPYNVIVDFHKVLSLHNHTLYRLMTLQQEFYDARQSLIYCNLQEVIEQQLDELSILENLNIAEDSEEAEEMMMSEIEEREF